MHATAKTVSLFDDHIKIVEACAEDRRLRGKSFSPALQFIIEDWRRRTEEEAEATRRSRPEAA